MLTASERIQRGCIDKVRQPDEATARARAMGMLQLGITKSRRAWVYPCRECRGWHITTTVNGNHASASVTATDPYVPSRWQA